jgi:hypothetical protein
MTIKVFETLLAKAQQAGVLQQKAVDAREWLREASSNTRISDPLKVIQQGSTQAVNQTKIGQMFLFKYDAAHKDTLPYYDMFPLIFPFRRVPGGFYGINMHYLPLPLRALLMDNLYDTINNDKADETTRLKISYNILSNAAKFRYFKPCVKHYLNSQVQTKFIYINPKEWDMALFLPLHKFKGATATTVYRDSRKTISGR